MKQQIPAVVIDGLNQYNALARSYEEDARCANLIGDSNAADAALRSAYGIRLKTAEFSAKLLGAYDAPQVAFRRSLAGLWLTCARHAARLKRFDVAREHALEGLRLNADPQTARSLRGMLVTVDLADKPAEVF